MTGLLIFLGLLGTFWGLLLTVGAVSDVIAGMSVGSGDINALFDQLKSGLARPLHGMGTAFSSSMFGLAGALVLGFLDLTAGQAQNRFFNELEEWLAGITRLSSGALGGEGEGSIPVYVQALLEQTAENMENLQSILVRGEDDRPAPTRRCKPSPNASPPCPIRCAPASSSCSASPKPRPSSAPPSPASPNAEPTTPRATTSATSNSTSNTSSPPANKAAPKPPPNSATTSASSPAPSPPSPRAPRRDGALPRRIGGFAPKPPPRGSAPWTPAKGSALGTGQVC